MVFASNIFILFLVIVLALYALAVRIRPQSGKYVLILVSLVFYANWVPVHLLLLLGSIVVNYLIARRLGIASGAVNRKILLVIGVASNLGAIAYFKYFDFFIENLNTLFGGSIPMAELVLPLGISFFTFQQIAFLVSVYRGELREVEFTNYLFFVSFFPQLIAGPIVSHLEMLPQLARKLDWRLRADHFSLGLFLFSVGLFKKSVLIDPFVPHIDVIFDHAATGGAISMLDGWTAAIGYSFQIYFDFSGYSDMAIGLAFMFGIRLPINFFSPYKAASIREFWRRWHITLSRFLLTHLYIPFGGSRHGLWRTGVAIAGTMTLGGLWHGAGWQFVLWGFVHGMMIFANHLWAKMRGRSTALSKICKTKVYRIFGIALTFTSVSVAWVLFRAADLGTAGRLLHAMFFGGSASSITDPLNSIVAIFPLYFLIIWFAPNAIQMTRRFPVALNRDRFAEQMTISRGIIFRFNWLWVLATVVLFIAGWFSLSNLSPFIYFQF